MSAIQICNTSKETIVLPRRTYHLQGWVIPACPDDKPFTSVVIEDHEDVRVVYTEYDASSAERIPVPVPAQTIVNDYFANEKLRQKGCFFLAAGEIPSQRQIQEARDTRIAFLSNLVEIADKEFMRSKRIDEIPEFCKNAVRELNLKREWAVVAPPPMQECPACGEAIKVGVAICKGCHAILDYAKAKEFGLIDGEDMPVSQSVNRQTKVGKKSGASETAIEGL